VSLRPHRTTLMQLMSVTLVQITISLTKLPKVARKVFVVLRTFMPQRVNVKVVEPIPDQMMQLPLVFKTLAQQLKYGMQQVYVPTVLRIPELTQLEPHV
jgi:hypothetical protein